MCRLSTTLPATRNEQRAISLRETRRGEGDRCTPSHCLQVGQRHAKCDDNAEQINGNRNFSQLNNDLHTAPSGRANSAGNPRNRQTISRMAADK